MAPTAAFLRAIPYDYAVIAVERAAKASEEDEADKEQWVEKVEELLIGREFWDMWPARMRDGSLRELRVVQDKEYLPPAEEHLLLAISPTLEHMRKSFCRIEYLVDQIARHPPRGADRRDWSATVHSWFKLGVLDHMNAHQFDEHNELDRDDVVNEFDLLAHFLAEGWKRRLPPLHDDDEDEDNDAFSQLKAMLFRHQGRPSLAHSLSRRGFTGPQLTERQRAVYGRRW
ncbi:hypothetical protein JCM9279_005305 [Rhodotorula babjevae]